MCNYSEGVERRATARGLAKGMEQGLKQGLEQGLAQGLEQGLVQGLEQGLEQGRMLEKISAVERLVTQRGMSIEEACELMELSVADYLASKDTIV